MREILFRGKSIENGEWYYGDWFHSSLEPYKGRIHDVIKRLNVPVIPETVGQYIGLTDKNGNKIFEGDICHFYGGEYYSGYWEANYTCKIEICADCLCYLENAEYIEIIGNIYDNPELIRGEE